MMRGGRPDSPWTWLAASAAVFVTLAAAVCGLTLLFLGTRSVMEVGGSCASGGPYQPVQSCPDGAPVAVFGGIWGGLIAVGLYVWMTRRYGVPGFLALAWPALFLSLGWNFLEFGLNSPGPDGGLEWGWLVCGVVFVLMGGGPLVLFFGPYLRGSLPFLGPGDPPAPGSGGGLRFSPPPPPLEVATVLWNPRPESGWNEGTSVASIDGDDGGGLVADLERLAALRRSGMLSEEEFARAKERLMEEEA
ncbi:MAG: SHOCT domain-containing protein [Hyphomicrobiales bacterium]